MMLPDHVARSDQDGGGGGGIAVDVDVDMAVPLQIENEPRYNGKDQLFNLFQRCRKFGLACTFLNLFYILIQTGMLYQHSKSANQVMSGCIWAILVMELIYNTALRILWHNLQSHYPDLNYDDGKAKSVLFTNYLNIIFMLLTFAFYIGDAGDRFVPGATLPLVAIPLFILIQLLAQPERYRDTTILTPPLMEFIQFHHGCFILSQFLLMIDLYFSIIMIALNFYGTETTNCWIVALCFLFLQLGIGIWIINKRKKYSAILNHNHDHLIERIWNLQMLYDVIIYVVMSIMEIIGLAEFYLIRESSHGMIFAIFVSIVAFLSTIATQLFGII